jgi:hypothetical protein
MGDIYNALRNNVFYDKVYKKYPSIKKYSKKEIEAVVKEWIEEARDIAVTNTDGLNLNRAIGTVFLGKSKYNKKIKRPAALQKFMEDRNLHIHPALIDYIMKIYFTTSAMKQKMSTSSIWKFKGAGELRSAAFWHFVNNYEKIMEINPKLKINAAFVVKNTNKAPKSTEEMIGEEFDEFEL